MSGKEVPFSFEDFNSFINSLYSVALQREYLSHRSNRLIEMVFGHIDDLEGSQEGATRLQALRAANCLKVLGKGVIRVVHRVEEARESCKLEPSLARLENGEGIRVSWGMCRRATLLDLSGFWGALLNMETSTGKNLMLMHGLEIVQ
eukprot:TCALIF_01504-PA protein Name:"Protein of unknown function" AED:0.25 eAED:0.25 QI:198/0.5/0.33/0.66/0.5/0.66/3/0/146